MAEGLLFLRYLIKSEYKKLNMELNEDTLIEYVQYYYNSLSSDDISRLNNTSQYFYSFQINNNENKSTTSINERTSPRNTLINENEVQFHKLNNCTLNSKISTSIPVLGDFNYNSRINQHSIRYLLGKKLVAAQLSKQFTSLPIDDSYINSHISSSVVDSVNEHYKLQSQILKKYSNFNSEEEIQSSLQYFQNIYDDGSKYSGIRKPTKITSSQLNNNNSNESEEENNENKEIILTSIQTTNNEKKKRKRKKE